MRIPTLLWSLALAQLFAGAVWAQVPQAAQPPQANLATLIDVRLDRSQGAAPVHMRAVLYLPQGSRFETALLFFRGGHGMSKITRAEDGRLNLPFFIGPHARYFYAAGIALVVMDCPTDQWGETNQGNRSTNCLDDYRSSSRHAEDVRVIMARLREDHGLRRLFVVGHSKGTISSRWLAVHLGNEISGSIHSGSLPGPDTFGNGQSLRNLPYGSITAPIAFVHNRNDACPVTPYQTMAAIAGRNLMTVQGGMPQGDPCGSGHFHSYQGREEVVARAIAAWIKDGTLTQLIGE